MSDFESTADMLVTTTPTIAGYRVVETKGAVLGIQLLHTDVESYRPNRPRFQNEHDIWEEVPLRPDEKPWHYLDDKKIVDGMEVMTSYGRTSSMKKMTDSAAALGANAVIDLRFESSLHNSQYSIREIVAYGTAVVIEKAKSE
jgi:uncharacterized protein YbjQ (UPF0145 family)